MTETTSVALLPDLNDYIPGTCGKLLASIDARLVDADGQDVKTGEPGELWIRGNNNMIGYHKNEKATKETINEDGWLMTGDVCVRSDGGHYTIVDRTKELIK
jgi:long-subunit acyl-CoA synthetase (AMP-forming)